MRYLGGPENGLVSASRTSRVGWSYREGHGSPQSHSGWVSMERVHAVEQEDKRTQD